MSDGLRLAASRRRAPASAALLAFATTLLSACSSFTVDLGVAPRNDAAKAIRTVYVILGPSDKLAAVKGISDPVEMTRRERQHDYTTSCEYQPATDARGKTTWTETTGNALEAGVEVDTRSGLTIVLGSSFVSSHPASSLLVIAVLQDRSTWSKLFDDSMIKSKQTYSYSIVDNKILDGKLQ
jgi:hypothetical protein